MYLANELHALTPAAPGGDSAARKVSQLCGCDTFIQRCSLLAVMHFICAIVLQPEPREMLLLQPRENGIQNCDTVPF